ncbi:hypothetical protein MAR_003868, partial [Mya arenaria]
LRTTGTIARERILSDDADDDEANNDEEVGTGDARPTETPEMEDDQPDWELGIRRSSLATGIVTMAIVYNITVIMLRVAFKEMRD